MSTHNVPQQSDLRNLTAWKLTEYDRTRLLRKVAWKVYGLCDPEDALQHALAVALKEYDPERKPDAFVNYILSVAFHYAWEQAHPSEKWTTISIDEEPENDKGKATSRYEYAFGTMDVLPEDQWINDDVIEAIADRIWQIPGHKRLSRVHACAMLKTHVETIENGHGIGYDELDAYRAQGKDPCRKKNQARYQLKYTPLHVLNEVREHTCDVYGMTPRHYYNAQALLRQATKQAVRQGYFE